MKAKVKNICTNLLVTVFSVVIALIVIEAGLRRCCFNNKFRGLSRCRT